MLQWYMFLITESEKNISLDWCLYLCGNLKRYLKCMSFTYRQPPSLGSSVLPMRELLWRSKFSYEAQWLRHLTTRIQLVERIKLCSIFAELIVTHTQLWHCTNFKIFLWKVVWEQKEKQEVKFNLKLVSNRQSEKPSEMYLKYLGLEQSNLFFQHSYAQIDRETMSPVVCPSELYLWHMNVEVLVKNCM